MKIPESIRELIAKRAFRPYNDAQFHGWSAGHGRLGRNRR